MNNVVEFPTKKVVEKVDKNEDRLSHIADEFLIVVLDKYLEQFDGNTSTDKFEQILMDTTMEFIKALSDSVDKYL